jgi:hypothetical protein
MTALDKSGANKSLHPVVFGWPLAAPLWPKAARQANIPKATPTIVFNATRAPPVLVLETFGTIDRAEDNEDAVADAFN